MDQSYLGLQSMSDEAMGGGKALLTESGFPSGLSDEVIDLLRPHGPKTMPPVRSCRCGPTAGRGPIADDAMAFTGRKVRIHHLGRAPVD